MQVYLIIAISFAIMYHIRYVRHAQICVKDTASLLKLEKKNSLSLSVYSILIGIFAMLVAPLFILMTLVTPRQEMIKLLTSSILKFFYDIEKSS